MDNNPEKSENDIVKYIRLKKKKSPKMEIADSRKNVSRDAFSRHFFIFLI